MEAKVRAELSALTENLQRMQDEMVRLADLEGLRSRAESRRMVCTKSLYQSNLSIIVLTAVPLGCE